MTYIAPKSQRNQGTKGLLLLLRLFSELKKSFNFFHCGVCCTQMTLRSEIIQRLITRPSMSIIRQLLTGFLRPQLNARHRPRFHGNRLMRGSGRGVHGNRLVTSLGHRTCWRWFWIPRCHRRIPMPVKPITSFHSATVRLVSRAAVRLKILIAINNRTRTRSTSSWHRITV